jgi:hypothetical protein
MQTTEIKPIINGSVNPRLTSEMFENLNPKQNVQLFGACWFQ